MKKRLLKFITLTVLSLALVAPAPLWAQRHRPGNKPNNERPEGKRPNRGDKPSHGNKPQNRPGKKKPSPPRHNAPSRPAEPPRPNRPSHPAAHNRPPHFSRPPRPVPPRPAPPRGYRPYMPAPAISSVFGIAFGTLFGNVLNYLEVNNYMIDGYVDNAIYVADVTELGFNWPYATLYCDAGGRFTSAQYVYLSSYDNSSRYGSLYRRLCSTYGMPVSQVRRGIGHEVIWYGGSGRGYVSLEYTLADSGYCTILSFSN